MNSEKSPLFGGFFIEAPTEENSILLVERKIGSTILIVRHCVLTSKRRGQEMNQEFLIHKNENMFRRLPMQHQVEGGSLFYAESSSMEMVRNSHL